MAQVRLIKKRPAQGQFMPRGNMSTPTRQMDIKAVQKFTAEQIYVLAEDYALGANANKAYQVDISGTPGLLLGLNLYDTTGAEVRFTFQINQETVIRTANVKFFTPNFNTTTKDQEFFKINRPISGQDKITITIESINAGKLYAAYYLKGI